MIEITGRSLTLDEVLQVTVGGASDVTLAAEARTGIERSRSYIRELLDQNERIYGVTTGFGRLAEVFISASRRSELQVNLVRSHSSGVGEPMSREETRAILLLRANALARGNSGCRLEVIERLLEFLRLGIHPRIPEAGSVGASGDLAPLAHVALAVIGEGEVELDGTVLPTPEALARTGLEPIRLVEKEGLALINGTQATTGLAVLCLSAAERAIETAEVAGASSLEGLRGTPEPFRKEIHESRPHEGQIRSANRLWNLMRDSEIRESHRYDDPRVHDAYSVRCMPQVHGAARQVLGYVRGVLETEINSSTDNPLVFPESELVVSAGNFHAQIVAQALDFLVIAMTDLASISERRIERLLNPDLSGLPAFLARDPGIQSGFMIAQVTAADLLAEMRVLAHPTSVDSVPTSGNKEDHVSMGLTAGRKARRAMECLEYVLSVELMCAAQAIDFLRPLTPGRGVTRAHRRIRERIEPLNGDRVLTGDIEAIREMLRSEAFASIATGSASSPETRDGRRESSELS